MCSSSSTEDEDAESVGKELAKIIKHIGKENIN